MTVSSMLAEDVFDPSGDTDFDEMLAEHRRRMAEAEAEIAERREEIEEQRREIEQRTAELRDTDPFDSGFGS